MHEMFNNIRELLLTSYFFKLVIIEKRSMKGIFILKVNNTHPGIQLSFFSIFLKPSRMSILPNLFLCFCIHAYKNTELQNFAVCVCMHVGTYGAYLVPTEFHTIGYCL